MTKRGFGRRPIFVCVPLYLTAQLRFANAQFRSDRICRCICQNLSRSFIGFMGWLGGLRVHALAHGHQSADAEHCAHAAAVGCAAEHLFAVVYLVFRKRRAGISAGCFCRRLPFALWWLASHTETIETGEVTKVVPADLRITVCVLHGVSRRVGALEAAGRASDVFLSQLVGWRRTRRCFCRADCTAYIFGSL